MKIKQTLRSAQEGIAHLMLIVVVVVLAAAGGAGYYVYSKQKTNKVVADLTPAAKQINDECVTELDDEDFCAFAASWDLNGSYTMTMTTMGKESTGVMTTKNDGKGNSQLTTKDKNGKLVSDMISLNDTSYIYNPTDKSWTKYESNTDTADPADEVDEELNISTEDLKNDNYEYKSLGKEACGTMTCFKYQLVDKKVPTQENFVWFDDDEYKARKMSFKEGDTTMVLEISYEAVTISEPSPIKEAPDYENMTAEELQEQMESLMEQYGQQ